MADDIHQLTYEQAVARLEELIDQIESGEIGLEESLKQYEQGTRLIARCQTILNRAEQKLAKLKVPDDEEEVEVEAEETDEDEDPDEGVDDDDVPF